MPILTFVDTLGIQSFVFASNRLRDVVGGSELVHQATSRQGWVDELGYKAQVIVGAGGNLLLHFDDAEQAREFAAQYSRKMLDKAPGLEVALVHHKYEDGQLAKAIQEVQVKIENHKLERCPSVPLLGLGVTATCQETRQPAVALDEGVPIAAGVDVRRKANDQDQARWLKFLPCDYQQFRKGKGGWVELAFPVELDDLGRSRGDTSLMGVVHIDGNGIGQKLKDWLEGQVKNGSDDTTVLNQYQALSKKLDGLAERVFKTLVDRVVAAIDWDDRRGYVLQSTLLRQRFALRCKQDTETDRLQLFLPIRPILLGGDDLTFVCDGRIALDLAATALIEFEEFEFEQKQTSLDPLGQVRACAGVALVKTHTPFARAYHLAESLCTSAKRRLRDEKWPDRSALDWHIGLSSPTETLAALRQRQYGGEKLPWTCRPYLLCQYAPSESEPDWNWLARDVLGTNDKGFQTSDPEKTPNWQAHRSKLKTLREIVREGEDEVRNTLEAWRVAHPKLALPDRMRDGFIGPHSPLLDALELLDIHFPLG